MYYNMIGQEDRKETRCNSNLQKIKQIQNYN